MASFSLTAPAYFFLAMVAFGSIQPLSERAPQGADDFLFCKKDGI
jgi:hypothetical protein